jgi:hypothetical protein
MPYIYYDYYPVLRFSCCLFLLIFGNKNFIQFSPIFSLLGAAHQAIFGEEPPNCVFFFVLILLSPF